MGYITCHERKFDKHPAPLLLSKSNGLFNSNGELLVERIECLIRRQVESIEAVIVSSVLNLLTRIAYQVCDFGS